jgi:hypothetical protein
MSGVVDVSSPAVEVSMGAEPVAGCEVGEPDASMPLCGEFADDSGDRDSAGTLAESVAPADGDVAVDESVDAESVDDESAEDESDADPESSAHATPAPSP